MATATAEFVVPKSIPRTGLPIPRAYQQSPKGVDGRSTQSWRGENDEPRPALGWTPDRGPAYTSSVPLSSASALSSVAAGSLPSVLSDGGSATSSAPPASVST